MTIAKDILHDLIIDTFNCEDCNAGLSKWGLFSQSDVELINGDNVDYEGIEVVDWKPDFVTFKIGNEHVSMKNIDGYWKTV
ncbi:hypothetical protein D1872_252460 [compost metagenome]